MEKFVRKGHEGVKYFVGPEIEQTPAYGKKTLFVVGLQDTKEVESLAREHKTPHIFLSANRSFDSVELRNGVYMVGDTLASDWEKQIHELLDRGFMVSLDYPAHKHVDVLKILNAGIWQCRNFVPVLSVAIPKVNTSSLNLTVKIDDSNFGETNPGVWCMHHSEVTDSNRFTSWEEYSDDLILTDDMISVVDTQAPVGSSPSVQTPAISEVKTETVAPSVDDEVKNNTELGLDPQSGSKLKPESEEEKAEALAKIAPNVTESDLLGAYAEGTKEDPLGKETSKKPVKKSKAP